MFLTSDERSYLEEDLETLGITDAKIQFASDFITVLHDVCSIGFTTLADLHIFSLAYGNNYSNLELVLL